MNIVTLSLLSHAPLNVKQPPQQNLFSGGVFMSQGLLLQRTAVHRDGKAWQMEGFAGTVVWWRPLVFVQGKEVSTYKMQGTVLQTVWLGQLYVGSL